MGYLELALAVVQLLGSIPFILKYMEKNLGKDWYKKQEEVKAANRMLADAKTPEEEDEALKAIANSFYK